MLNFKKRWNLWPCALLLLFGMLSTNVLQAQVNITFDLKKPKNYENRKLPSELTPDKKIGPIKRLKENTFSHYNFYFNSNQKIQKIIASAKQAHKDTFNTLLSFFNYDLNATAQQQQELDSVVIKVNNGVLLHDLRNDWVDDLYFLMGQSYFFQKKFDSAYDVFQYINYNFQPKEKSERGFEKTIGSNINNSGNVYTISSKETGLGGHKPIRNETLLWIIRTLMEQDNDDDARGMIETLVRDIDFPKRLQPFLFELKSYWFYKIQQYDSSARFMELAIPVCFNKQEKARMYFLIAQLYARANDREAANESFEKSVALTTDPVMAAYAKIYQISLASDKKDRNEKIEEDVKALVKLASREKYISYRPIIFAAASEMELSRDSINRAIQLLESSNKYNSNDQELKLKNNLTIATLAFANKKYELSKKYFDSTLNTQPGFTKEIELKKSIVTDLANALSIIEKEDSLQMIAAMPEKQREIYIKELLKKLRKEEGLKVDNSNTGLTSRKNNLLEDQAADLFQTQDKSGEWYFNNPTLKSQGSIAFKNKWGNRNNEDNWRRSNAGSAMTGIKRQNNLDNLSKDDQDSKNTATEINFELLADNLPTSSDKLLASNARKSGGIKILSALYKDKLGDYKESIFWNKQLLNIETDSASMIQAYFDLAFCYKQLDSTEQANFYAALLKKFSPDGPLTKMLLNPTKTEKQDKTKTIAVEKAYNEIYNQFISGEFGKALTNKKQADSLYGESYWTPQLLYIEAVYYIKERKDSSAIATLSNLEKIAPNSPLASKSIVLREVLKNRDSIEAQLKAMKVTRMKDDEPEVVDTRPAIAPKRMIRDDNNLLKIDSSKLVKSTEEKPIIPSAYQFDPKEPYGVLMLMNGVDIVYVNEAKRALTRYHTEKYFSKTFSIRNDKIGDTPYILISLFADAAEAVSYVEKIKPISTKEVFPWLPADKYSFYIVSPGNLKKMLEDKETLKYIEFLKAQFPGKF
jgi:tetratricopeptide (TPR) repeat protein